MNDLEHDLRELFEQRATDVDVPGLAPKQVLKRGRRRQLGTIVTGVVACLIAIGVTAAAVGDARHPAVIPGDGNGLPARTTSIGGVPVTAPAGWTLVDDLPLAAILATTSESCSFSATGSPVEGTGSAVEGNGSSSSQAVLSASPSSGGTSDGTGPSSGPTCTTQNVGYPQGVPILQLANFAIPLTKTVCGLADQQSPAPLPDDGVAVYVADLQASANIPALQSACPGSDSAPAGLPQVFMDTAHRTDYAAIAVAGPDASAADLAVARDYMLSLVGVEVSPVPPPTDSGPGYVMATGKGGDTSWRLEAGLTSLARTPTVGATMVTTTTSGTSAHTVGFPTGQRVSDDVIDLGGGAGVVQFGTAAAGVTGVSIAPPSGETITATMLPWPPQTAVPNVSSGDGWVWFAQAPVPGDVRASVPSAPTTAPTGSATGEAGQLNVRQDANGHTVIYGHDLGHDWEIRPRQQDGIVEFFVDGSQDPVHSLSFAMGLGTEIDVGGGTFVLSLQDPTVHRLAVTTDAVDTQPSTTIEGRWAPTKDTAGNYGRIWLVPLPGSGTGTEQINSDLPNFVSWPTSPTRNGTLLAGGSDGTISWGLRWRDAHCVQLVTLSATEGDSGTSSCLPPWPDLNGDPLVGGFYGSTTDTMAIVVPNDPTTTVRSPDLLNGAVQCSDFASVPSFTGTTMCVFRVDIGSTVTLNLDQQGDPLNGPITIEGMPGAPTITRRGSVSPAVPTASP